MNTAYATVAEKVRARLRAGRSADSLYAITRETQRACETLDLTAVGIRRAVLEEHFGEAQLRADAAERAAEDLLATVQTLAIAIREARLARSAAA